MGSEERQLLLELVDEVREVRRLAERASEPLPQVLTFKAAAKQLSVGMTKFRGMVKSEKVLTCELGGGRGVPVSEIYRLAQPAKVVPQRGGKNAPRSSSKPADEARAIRALAKKRR